MTSFQFKTTNGAYPVNVNINPSSTEHRPNQALIDKASKTTIIFLNALGVPLRKYSKFINGLTEKGFTVISTDYPNCGENTPHIKRGIDYGYDELVNHFVHNLVQIAKDHTPDNDIVLIGHSLGGHLGTIYSAIHNVPVIGIACGSTHYKSWKGRGRIRILLAVAVIQALIRVYGFLPGYKIGLGEREAKTMMQEWCETALTGKFDYITQPLDTDKGHGLYINIEGDKFAPMLSTWKLAQMCSRSKVIQVTLDDDLIGNPHGVWIKRPEIVINAVCDNLDF
ncbi:alpha/beta fold hydrolase [Psychrobacter lutiphocae]|uniref:alpha/beta fold hydrolase n=1 Tax=Psychrobacter lutiphocae TaxID=540500 RepID=UPI00036EC00C|nr:alpha/beta fold hydrolase [Psychrobacter lutiphocae]